MPSLVTGIIGAIQGSSAAHNAADTQVNAYTKAGDTVGGAVNTANDLIGSGVTNVQDTLAPYTTLGTNAANTLGQFTAPGANATALMQSLDPGYSFRLQQGMQGVQQSAASAGLLQSGAAARGLNNYAQNYASNEYQNTFNRLASLSQMGQQAGEFLGGTQMQAANEKAANTTSAGVYKGNATIGAGNAIAQGDVGAANQWNNMLGGIGQAGNMMLGAGFAGGGGFNFGNALAGLNPLSSFGSSSSMGPSYNMQQGAPSYYNDLGYIG